MKRKIFGYLIIATCVFMLCGCKKEKTDSADRLYITVNNERREAIFGKIKKTDKSISEKETKKVEEGIKNWARATLGIDSSYSEESAQIMNKKLYDIVISEEQRESLKKERDKFYQASDVQTESIQVEIENANEAIYSEKTIGYVECDVIIAGKRDGKSFEKTYQLVLLMEYQENIASVYEVVEIELKESK